MIKPTEKDIGRRVKHKNEHTYGEEYGLIETIRDDYVFVRIEQGFSVPKACLREDLEWAE